MKNEPLSYIEISKKNLINNVLQFKKLLNNKAKIAAVIKSNAYGHGDIEIVKIISSKVDYFQIDSIEEFERIKSLTLKPILILGYLNENGLRKAISGGAIVCAFDFIHMLKINNISRSLKKITKVHLAVDSYLGREGITMDKIPNLIKEIKLMKNIEIDGMYSHFANIEDTMNFSHANKQIDSYHKAVKIFKESGYPKIKTHISATSGILVYEKGACSHDIARLGIGLYGMWPSEHLEYLNKKNIVLKPIMRWITHVAQVKILPANYPIGYGLTYITKKKTKIAIIPQGYFDGLTRSLSNNGEFIIRGKKAKIIGRVAMNMTVVDVSNIKDVTTDDEVVILGYSSDNKKSVITAEEIAKRMGTINYEVTTKINPFLPRIIK